MLDLYWCDAVHEGRFGQLGEIFRLWANTEAQLSNSQDTADVGNEQYILLKMPCVQHCQSGRANISLFISLSNTEVNTDQMVL